MDLFDQRRAIANATNNGKIWWHRITVFLSMANKVCADPRIRRDRVAEKNKMMFEKSAVLGTGWGV